MPSKKACWAHQFQYLGVGQQYPVRFLRLIDEPACGSRKSTIVQQQETVTRFAQGTKSCILEQGMLQVKTAGLTFTAPAASGREPSGAAQCVTLEKILSKEK